MNKSPSLADHLPFDLLAEVALHRGSHPKDAAGKDEWGTPAAQAWFETYSAQADKLQGCLKQFLLALRESRPLAQVAHAKGRCHHFATSWNAFATRQENQYTLDSISQFLSGGLFVHVSSKEEELQATYDAIVRKCDAGDFVWFDFGSSAGECQVTGDRLYVEVSNWTPSLGTVAHLAKLESEFTPIQALPPAKVSYHAINVPSGELLIADWFRVPEFTKAVADPAAERYTYSINNDAGKLRQAAWYAQAHGFMSVSVGNSLPRVVTRDGHIVISSLNEDAEDDSQCSSLKGEVKGYVCTDLWWATAIDREVLTQIVAQHMPRADAELAISTMLEKTTHTSIKVRPGVLHVYHTAKPEAMQNFRSPAVPHGGIEQLYAVLSEETLTWTHKLEMTNEVSASSKPARRPRP